MESRFRLRVVWTFAVLIAVTTWLCLTTILYMSHEKFRRQKHDLYTKNIKANIDFTLKEQQSNHTVSKDDKTGHVEKKFESRFLSEFESVRNFDGQDDVITLDDVFISVKTSGKFHSTRLDLILRTWWNTAKEQTYIFTDIDDPQLTNRTNGHIINTNCSASHHRKDLSCKMSQEYDMFIDLSKKWWCHFDDDNYVNIAKLLALLRNYNWKSDVYLGRPSINHVVEAIYMGRKVLFWFATGGAGVCISRGLGEKMASWSRNGKLQVTSDRIKLPDDCTIGFIINNRLGVELTKVDEFHSHLEQLSLIPEDKLYQQISLSYYIEGQKEPNIVEFSKKVPKYPPTVDPTGILSLHCLLHPKTDWCTNRQKVTR